MTKTELVLEWLTSYAVANKWHLNPNEEVVSRIIKGLLKNEVNFGEMYCPCRVKSGNRKTDEAIICPCKSHREEIEADGHCHCNLYFKE